MIGGILVADVGVHRDAVLVASVVEPYVIAAAGDERVFELWSVCTDEADRPQFEDMAGAGTALAVGKAGEIVLGSSDGALIIHDGSRQPHLLRKSGSPVNAVALAPDGKRAVVLDTQTRIWSLATGKSMAIAINHAKDLSAAWSQDGRAVAIGDTDGTIRLFDVSGDAPRPTRSLHATCGGARSIVFSPDGTRLIVGTEIDGSCQPGVEERAAAVEVWNLAGTAPTLEESWPVSVLSVASLAVSRAGLLAAADGFEVDLWSLATHELVAVLRDAGETVHSVAFSDDGAYLVTTSGLRRLRGRPGVDNSVRLYWLKELKGAP